MEKDVGGKSEGWVAELVELEGDRGVFEKEEFVYLFIVPESGGRSLVCEDGKWVRESRIGEGSE